MAKAMWNGVVLAESDDFEVVDSNVYFPKSAIVAEYFSPSDTTSKCFWKGQASYFDVVVGGQTNKDAAWVYEQPKDAASNIAGHVAFWKGVIVER